MIKVIKDTPQFNNILIEEPVAYNIWEEDEIDNPDTWVYKNPTQKEVDSLRQKRSVRLLTYNNDLYLANGYYWIHYEMANALNSYTKLDYNSYNCYYIDRSDNQLFVGDKYGLKERIKVLNNLKPFIIRLKELGLINNSTGVRTIDKYVELKDFYKEN